jgi:hypothetical protein
VTWHDILRAVAWIALLGFILMAIIAFIYNFVATFGGA